MTSTVGTRQPQYGAAISKANACQGLQTLACAPVRSMQQRITCDALHLPAKPTDDAGSQTLIQREWKADGKHSLAHLDSARAHLVSQHPDAGTLRPWHKPEGEAAVAEASSVVQPQNQSH